MRINDSMSHAFHGLQQGLNQAAQAADEVVKSTVDNRGGVQDTVEPLMKLNAAQRQVEANTAVVRTHDDMLGTMIDVRA